MLQRCSLINNIVKKNIVKYIRRKSSLAHFATALELKVNLMPASNIILFKIKVFGGKITLTMYLIKITAL